MKIFRKLLGQLGLNWCPHCGRKLVFAGWKSYYMDEVWECPHCDHLDRFDVDDFKYKGGEKENAKKSKNKKEL